MVTPNGKKRILIVEDDESISLGLRMNLEAEGYEVALAADGEEGLTRASSGGVDLVILDVMLPKVNGFEVVRRLRAQQDTVPVIMLSARGAEMDKVMGLELGAEDYITKPFSLAELLARVKAVLRRDGLSRKHVEAVVQAGELTIDSGPRFVSRGGEKLEAALEAFAIDVSGLTCADVGSSTGGFTDCLLQRGAAKVYAIDVGKGVLHWKLRNDPRVVVFEKTNIRYLKPASLPSRANLATIDVSFISLKVVLPAVIALLTRHHQIIALIKPQFEVGKGKVGKGGVVRSADEHRRVIEEIIASVAARGYEVGGVTESPMLGAKGNKEFLLYIRSPE